MPTPNLIEASVGSVAPAQPAAPVPPVPLIQDGCYYLRYTPKNINDPNILYYEGTMRVLHVSSDGEINPDGEIKAGGDLYAHTRGYWGAGPGPDLLTIGDVPIFPRSEYRYYLEIIKVLQGENSNDQVFTARFRIHEFDVDTIWPNPGVRIIVMNRVNPPQAIKAYPMPPGAKEPLYFSGIIRNEETGDEVGTVVMGWVSQHLRRASIIVDQVEGVKGPVDPDMWNQAFGKVCWNMRIFPRTAAVSGLLSKTDEWTLSELHSAMLQAKNQVPRLDHITFDPSLQVISNPSTNPDPFLDTDWCFHLLCVKMIEGFERGVMYDVGGSDSNNTPREGAAIACEWPFSPPEDWGQPGEAKMKLQESTDVCFRVAAHEIGHAMGLDHNFKNFGFMCTTDVIAKDRVNVAKGLRDLAASARERFEEATAFAIALGKKSAVKPVADTVRKKAAAAESDLKKNEELAVKASFANKLKMEFHLDDLNRLRFGPDVSVRPGTTFEHGGPFFDEGDISAAEHFELNVSPLLETVPLGAPVRIVLRLVNTSDADQSAPESISFSSGLMSGYVTDPNGNRRSFWPIKKCFDKEPKQMIGPSGSVADALTLLRGAQGALFPIDGRHRIHVRVTWNKDKQRVFCEGDTDVYISPPANDAHRVTALRLLATPDVLLSIAIGGRHLVDGNAAIASAAGNEVLKPHYRMSMFMLLAQTQFEKACLELDESAVLSFSEIKKIATVLEKAACQSPVLENVVRILQDKLSQLTSYGSADSTSSDKIRKLLAGIPVLLNSAPASVSAPAASTVPVTSSGARP